ncbi:Aldehyde oxidase/xanthine dehydrogenase [Carpediemonas membranifera]|uniref:Aldehyde oxidase/xanthine dehydrogenase n=1 Tax=Carpediemonas membranifera TaxID=201153 RepID=A0A8J6E0S0_9EUKA|nr:Aldehyde oxidase/xanthine dehydrogenase [Carpediemonas membranifera]|eukprot:KAG9389707.1 Aldehyde oxidase/xanthine dehydrogenase [Carpediemonas membranifera]
MTSASSIVFYLNGKRIETSDFDPLQPVADYLHVHRHTGTKVSCGEGGCGACTILLSHYDEESVCVRHRAVVSCILPMVSIDNCMITTVEGLKGKNGSLHPIQERVSEYHGTQCGYCTPGIIMALAAFLLNNPNMKAAEIEHSFDCNLCRCTGYFPILAAAKSFASDYEDAFASRPMSKLHKPMTYGPIDFTLPFPAELKGRRLQTEVFTTETATVHRPVTVADIPLVAGAQFFNGATEVAIDRRARPDSRAKTLVHLAHVAGLGTISHDDNTITIGGAATLSDVAEWADHRAAITDLSVAALREQLRYFASGQVRSVATVAGNVVNASPISDLVPVLMAADASVVLLGPGGSRTMAVSEFITGYRRTAIQPGELVTAVTVPRSTRYVKAFKLSRRKEDDISSVNAGISFSLEHGAVVRPVIAMGGLAAMTKRAPKTEAFLQGKALTRATALEAAGILGQEMQLTADAPGAMVSFRPVAAATLLFRAMAGAAKHYGVDTFTKDDLESAEGLQRTHDVSYVYHDVEDADHHDGEGCGEAHVSARHLSSKTQVKGNAEYVSLMPVPAGTVDVAIVGSPVPHARVTGVDTAPALAVPGVVAVLTSEDLPAATMIGLAAKDERFLVGIGEEAMYAGHPIALVAAEDMEAARAGVRAVKVEYEVLKPHLTVEDAIEANDMIIPTKCLDSGDFDAAWEQCASKAEGSVRLPAQEHFYLETQAAVAVPVDDVGMKVFVTTQNPNAIHESLAAVLGVRQSDVTVHIRRLGGAFGGKESNLLYPDVAAVVARHTDRPARVVLDRDADMVSTGKRHPARIDYRIGCDAEGHITALDFNIYLNSGFSLDLSASVLERACLHADGSYNIPNVRVRGYACRTHLPSNTAFRGFGAPQAIFAIEQAVEHLAFVHKADPLAIRRLNFYRSGDRTHFDQEIPDSHLHKVWDALLKSSKYQTRRQEVDLWNSSHAVLKRGLAVTPVKFGVSFTQSYLNQASALVHIYKDGTVLVSHGGIEMGQGVHTKVAQIAADTLQVPLSSVQIQETATDKTANVAPTSASTGSDLNGMAVKYACEELADRLAPYRAKYPDLPFNQLCVKAWFDRVDLSAHGFYKTPLSGFDFVTQTGEAFAYFTFGAAVAEVEVDVQTGDHHVLRTDILFDVGRSINPAIDVGQVEGAFIQGMGWLTTEDFITLTNGTAVSRGPGSYKIPGAGDIPDDFRLSFLKNSVNPRAVRSSKGVGEPPFCLGQVVPFAIWDALRAGRDDYFALEMPATIEHIRMASKDEVSDACGLGNVKSTWRIENM